MRKVESRSKELRTERLAGEFECLRIEEDEGPVPQQPTRQEGDAAAVGVEVPRERPQLMPQEEEQEEEEDEEGKEKRNDAQPEVREDTEVPVEAPFYELGEPLFAIRELVL